MKADLECSMRKSLAVVEAVLLVKRRELERVRLFLIVERETFRL